MEGAEQGAFFSKGVVKNGLRGGLSPLYETQFQNSQPSDFISHRQSWDFDHFGTIEKSGFPGSICLVIQDLSFS